MQSEHDYCRQIETTISNTGAEPSPLLVSIFAAQRRAEIQYHEWITATPLESLLVAWTAHRAVEFDTTAWRMLRRLLWIEFSRRGELLLIIEPVIKDKISYLLQIGKSERATAALPTILPQYSTADLKAIWDAMDHYHPDSEGSINLVEQVHAEMNRRGEGRYVAV